MDGFWSQQLELFPAPPAGRDAGWDDRVYFALVPDQTARRELAAFARDLAQRHRLGGRPKPQTFHVSVLGIGYYRDVTTPMLDAAVAAAESLVCRPFELGFVDVLSFGKTRKNAGFPLVLRCGPGADGVTYLAETLAEDMRARHCPPAGHARGTPHLTLLYDRKHLPSTRLDPPITMDVAGIALVRNHHGESRHDTRFFPFHR